MANFIERWWISDNGTFTGGTCMFDLRDISAVFEVRKDFEHWKDESVMIVGDILCVKLACGNEFNIVDTMDGLKGLLSEIEER